MLIEKNSKIFYILEKEKNLNKKLNFENIYYTDINHQFKELFQNIFYKQTKEWLDKNKILSLHDSYIINFSEKRELNLYNISFIVDEISIYNEDNIKIGYIKDSIFNIKSKDNLRNISKSIILNFLIDEENKEIAFLYLKENKRKIISIKYDNINLKKGTEIFYKNEKKNKIKIT